MCFFVFFFRKTALYSPLDSRRPLGGGGVLITLNSHNSVFFCGYERGYPPAGRREKGIPFSFSFLLRPEYTGLLARYSDSIPARIGAKVMAGFFTKDTLWECPVIVLEVLHPVLRSKTGAGHSPARPAPGCLGKPASPNRFPFFPFFFFCRELFTLAVARNASLFPCFSFSRSDPAKLFRAAPLEQRIGIIPKIAPPSSSDRLPLLAGSIADRLKKAAFRF